MNLKDINSKLTTGTVDNIDEKSVKILKTKLWELEDEDIVNMDESSMSEDCNSQFPSKSDEKVLLKHSKDYYNTNSPEVNKKKMFETYYSTNDNGCYSIHPKPWGDYEDEIVFELDDATDIEFPRSIKGNLPILKF
jgi:hypothetical protein